MSVMEDTPSADALTLAHYAERAYLEYALSVVKGRALPDVCDGQKPVQRRILYAMHRMGLATSISRGTAGATGVSAASGARPVKSARVVGDVLGRFHPHGDQAAYDAMVRMAQDFSLRYPLIDGQGNFGSRDGDGAAAMRYTEARLAPIARLLMDEIDAGTVDFMPNYDGSTEEPRQLPARLPFVLLNGASGVAVGLATEIPSHNLREVAALAVALLRDASLSDEAMYALLPGPDFPGGAQIIASSEEVQAAYRSGRGSIKVRARWVIEELARGQWQWVVTELPPGTSSQKILEEIEALTNPKIKLGKKALTPDQVQLKALVLNVLDTVRDESGKTAAVRLVLEPRSRTTDVQELIALLLAHTSLETSVPINMTMIGLDGRPVQKGLRTIVQEWLDFRQVTLRRRSQHRLDRLLERIHVLEGRQIVWLNLDAVIRVIRDSDEPKAALMAQFALSERQADDILEIRLRQLARLEHLKIEQELAQLRSEQQQLENLLAHPEVLQRHMIREIEADAKQYGDERRTLIQAEKKTVTELKVLDEPVTVVISQKGWVRSRQGHGHEASAFAFKAGDGLYATFECRTVDPLLVLGSHGRVYTVAVSSLPGARGDGQPITSLIDLEPGTQPLHYVAAAPETRFWLAQSGGTGLIASVADMVSRQKGGKSFLSLEPGEQPLRPMRLSASHTQAACLSRSGRLLVYPLTELKHQPGGGRGLTLIGATDPLTDPLIAVQPFHLSLRLTGQGRGAKARDDELKGARLATHTAKRARPGVVVAGFVKVEAMAAD
ncbi:DNA topoisomerase IV subunit A [Leptothrix ochracea]